MKALVIVESPAKARTINKFLGKDFTVKASVGHVKDLPKKELGVDVEKDFAPKYVVIEGKGKVLKELKKMAKEVGKIFLAPDPDREGEAIAWHIAEELNGDSDKVRRIIFNEITERAVLEAIKNPRKIDMNLVEAQQARRILDRLVGYGLSPLLWRKVRRGLSAGRVQSVALRLIVDRERIIEAFKPEEYWSITTDLEGKEPPPFSARLFSIRDKKVDIKNESEAKSAVEALDGRAFIVKKIEKKDRRRSPAPPFITSTLQQEASRKLRFGAKKTMLLAQQLYEGLELGTTSVGLITYMRTDSVRVASEAQEEARAFILEKFGSNYAPQKPPIYKSKESAQGAHETIRPTSILRTPETVKKYLTKDQYFLYTLIWNRFTASQMSHALLEQTSIDIGAGDYIFRATGTVVKFPGFMTIYTEGIDDSLVEEGDLLPSVKEGETLKVINIQPKQHFTQPPPRYNEATLVKDLEAKGIGRPSTYATILSTIQERKYTERIDGRFKPTELGAVVNDLLVEKFPELMDVSFTAKMEEELDRVEEGLLKWVRVVRDFYTPFDRDLTEAAKSLGKIRPKDITTEILCEKCGQPMVIRWGRHGRFMACSGYPACKNAKPVSIGIKCPEDGGEIIERKTRKGKTFFSCSNYPKCTFATWYRPVLKACSDCGADFLVEKKTKKGEFLICIKKGCSYKEEIQETTAEQPVAKV